MPCSLNAVPANKTIPQGKTELFCMKRLLQVEKEKGRRITGGTGSVLLMGLLFSPETEGRPGGSACHNKIDAD